MDRFRRLAEFWQWLPAFRAVAESEHLPTAAAELHVTPSAVSRSIRQLEAALGVALFERVGRRLVLTPDGRDLLEQVRDAMRRVDDGVSRLRGEELHGRVRIACAGALSTTVLLPVLAAVVARHPGLDASISMEEPGAVGARLRRGELDLALQVFPVHGDGVESVAVGRLRLAVFAGGDHPLHAVDEPTPAQLAAHPFVGPPAAPDGQAHDGWPEEWPARRFALQIDQLRVGVDAAVLLGLLVVLPCELVERTGAPLRALRLGAELPSRPVFAVQRAALDPTGERPLSAARIVRDEVAAQLRE